MSKISYLNIKKKEIVSSRGGLSKTLGRKKHLHWALTSID